jgi:hypothetical protein
MWSLTITITIISSHSNITNSTSTSTSIDPRFNLRLRSFRLLPHCALSAAAVCCHLHREEGVEVAAAIKEAVAQQQQ